MSKNAGKTTSMNAFIKKHEQSAIGITSIGLDGESIDQITYLPKPKILVKKGMHVATAFNCLSDDHIEYQLVKRTGIYSALGEIVIVKILKDTPVLVAGPTTKRELKKIITLLKEPSDLVFIDGALNRTTFAALSSIDSVVLAIGASYHENQTRLIEDAHALIHQLTLKKTERLKDRARPGMLIQTKDEHLTIKDKSLEAFEEALKNHDGIKMIYLKGACTKRYIDMLIKYRVTNCLLVVDDPTKLLFEPKYYKYLATLNIALEVMHPLTLECITINPHSVYGHDVDANWLKAVLKTKASIEIMNVLETE